MLYVAACCTVVHGESMSHLILYVYRAADGNKVTMNLDVGFSPKQWWFCLGSFRFSYDCDHWVHKQFTHVTTMNPYTRVFMTFKECLACVLLCVFTNCAPKNLWSIKGLCCSCIRMKTSDRRWIAWFDCWKPCIDLVQARDSFSSKTAASWYFRSFSVVPHMSQTHWYLDSALAIGLTKYSSWSQSSPSSPQPWRIKTDNKNKQTGQ